MLRRYGASGPYEMFNCLPTSETEWLSEDASVFDHGDFFGSHCGVARSHGTSGPSGSRAKTYFASSVEEPLGGEAPAELVGSHVDSGPAASTCKDLPDSITIERSAALATPQGVVSVDA